MTDRGPDRDEVRSVGKTGDTGPRDAGKTSGGGSLGHVQPDKVQSEAPLRNNAEHRESDDPVLPSDESTLNTKI